MTNLPHTHPCAKLEKNGIRKKKKKEKRRKSRSTGEPQFGEAPERLE